MSWKTTILSDGSKIIEITSQKYVEYLDQNDCYHREGAPARIWTDHTYREWYIHDLIGQETASLVLAVIDGKLHREDGPTIDGEYDEIQSTPSPVWAWNGKRLDCKTNEELLQLMKLKAFW
jgi:hypothetical protein